MENDTQEFISGMSSKDSSVNRLSYAIRLMRKQGREVEQAYIHSLNDRSEKMILLSCKQLGDRCVADAADPLLALLTHASWDIRIESCKALLSIQSGSVKHNDVLNKVFQTLAELSAFPEAQKYDSDIKQISRDYGYEYGVEKGRIFGTLSFLSDQCYKLASL